MYIPLTFFGSQGSCITATTTSITGSGLITTGSFISGGYYWQYYQFEMTDLTATGLTPFTASLNILSGSTGQAKLLVVAAGGTAGRRQQYFNPGGTITYQTDYSGGGGAGGVVYYDNFTLASGSYEIGVANATPGNGGATGSTGNNSYIKLPNNRTYTPFGNSYILAEGGGAGGALGLYQQLSPRQDFYYSLGPGNGGSAGGAGSSIGGDAQGGQGIPNSNGGLSQPQGYIGGLAAGVSPSTGGGGAASKGDNSVVEGNTKTQGGDGILYNLTGTPTYYASGGPGAGRAYKAGSYGRGGNSPSTIGAYGDVGQAGVVVIAWPICSSKFSCKTFAITGSGGPIYWEECSYGQYVTQSAYIGNGYGFTACLTTWSGSNTPLYLDGAITTASVIGNCDVAYTSSNACNCTSYYYVPNGTQTLTWADCASSLLRSQSISTGTIKCTNPDIPGQGLTGEGSTITLLGTCATASCYYGSTLIQNCSTLVTASVNFTGSYVYVPTVGNVFKSIDAGLSGSCWNVIATGISQSLDYYNVSTYAQYTNCSTCIASTGSFLIDYLVVGGGGAGGGFTGGGGGAGQFQSGSNSLISTGTTYPVLIASGGVATGTTGSNGGSSSFNSIVSIGGGRGGASGDDSNWWAGGNGASGGGGSWYNGGAGGTGSAGNNGGTGISGNRDSGGGGGARTTGSNGTATANGSNGGAGKAWVDGNYYAGGGGGLRSDFVFTSSVGIGGIGGGGNGNAMSFTSQYYRTASSGEPNTGGGGGGAFTGITSSGSWDGGSGVVKIRYAGSGSLATGGTITYSGSYTYHTFTASGDFITN
jgi:hypothetical protein